MMRGLLHPDHGVQLQSGAVHINRAWLGIHSLRLTGIKTEDVTHYPSSSHPHLDDPSPRRQGHVRQSSEPHPFHEVCPFTAWLTHLSTARFSLATPLSFVFLPDPVRNPKDSSKDDQRDLVIQCTLCFARSGSFLTFTSLSP